MKLSINEVMLLEHTIVYTGETEIQNDKEVLSKRTFNVLEIVQRRHFNKNTKELFDKFIELEKERIAFIEKTKTDDPKKEGESQEEYEERLNSFLSKNEEAMELGKKHVETKKEEHEIEMTDKTKSFLRKYFEEFGEEHGYNDSDGEVVESLSEKLK